MSQRFLFSARYEAPATAPIYKRFVAFDWYEAAIMADGSMCPSDMKLVRLRCFGPVVEGSRVA